MKKERRYEYEQPRHFAVPDIAAPLPVPKEPVGGWKTIEEYEKFYLAHLAAVRSSD